MKFIEAYSAGDALRQGVRLLEQFGKREPSRGGEVLVAPWPVVTINRRPLNRVLFSATRNANPFFHLVEAAWMLAGRDTAADLIPYVKRFSEFTEDGGTVHGAYGKRWRYHFGFDQITEVIDKLRKNLGDRQAVLTMWDPTDDIDAANDLRGYWKDRPCNTHIYFRVIEGHLTSSVMCRSNDAIWGAHGANVVHFSYLHELIASALNLRVGIMYQYSFNYHAYVAEFERLRGGDLYDVRYADHLTTSQVHASPMGFYADVVADLPVLWKLLDAAREDRPMSGFSLKSMFAHTVFDAAMAHKMHRAGHHTNAMIHIDAIAPIDWREACREWIQRRQEA